MKEASTNEEISVVQKEGNRNVERDLHFYNKEVSYALLSIRAKIPC